MYDQERQSKSIQCLTKYLQYFKTYFSLSFSLIECHTFPAKFTPVQLENVTQKITHKKFDIAFQESPFNLWISDNAKSYIDRFYMRIVEFLEYRLNIFKAPDADQKLSSVINSFIGSLHKFFKTLTSKEFQNDNEKIVIGQVFFEIEGMVRKLVNMIFDHLEKMSQKSTTNLEEIKFSRKLINEQVFITFSHKLEQLQKESEIGNYQINGDAFSNEVYENGKMVRKPRSKSQFRVENFYSLGSKSLRQSKMTDPNHFFNIRRLYPNAVDLQTQKSQQFTKKSVFAQNLAIMDIEDVEVYSRDYIMEELQRKNTVNKQIIKKYIQIYKKKAKKHKNRAEFFQEAEAQVKKELSVKKIDVLNFQTKSKSEINVNISLEKIYPVPPVPMIKGNSIFVQNKPSIETLRIQKVAKPLTQGNLSKVLHILEQKQEPKSRSETIRQQIIKKTTVNQNPEFEMNRETFAYKEKQKMYFQSLKNKMTLQNQKITKKLQSIRSQNESTVKKIDKISIPTITETPPNDYRKMFRKNIKKNATKGSSFLSNKTDDRVKGSNSNIFSKNELTSVSIDAHMVSLEGSTLSKRMPKRGKLMKFLQNEDMINSALAEEINKVSNKNTSKIQNQSYIDPDSSVLVLPRISSNKKQLHPQK